MDLRKPVELLDGPGYSIEIFRVPWDSEIFGYPVAQIDRIEITEQSQTALAGGQVRDWLRERGVRLASCRLPSLRLRESMALEDVGFRFVEMVYSPALVLERSWSLSDERIIIDDASPSDLPAIESIARTAFSTSRFLIDWRLEGAASHRRYQVWVRNSFVDPAQRVLKVTIDAATVGFFILEDRPDGAVYWHLTAIAPEWQGRGLGRQVWTAMIARHVAAGKSRIETTISAHNTPVMNIYARLGFRFGPPQTTFHWARE